MSLGRSAGDPKSDVAVARMAMEQDLWFHSCRRYGEGRTFGVLRTAFDEAPSQKPKCIFKIMCENSQTIEDDALFTLKSLGLDRIDIAQLSGMKHDGRDIVDDFIIKGPMFQTCQRLKEKGLVGNYAFEIFYTYSSDALKAVQNDLFDGYVFYYNLLERQVSNEIMSEIMARGLPILSLRTVAGAFLLSEEKAGERRAKDPSFPMFKRIAEIEPIFKKSGCDNYLDLSMKFLASNPNVVTTIGGTADQNHLREYIETSRNAGPLSPGIAADITRLHEKWCRESEAYSFAKELY